MAHKPYIHFIRAAGADVQVRLQLRQYGWPMDWCMTPRRGRGAGVAAARGGGRRAACLS